MGLFSAGKVVTVGSTTYNLAGPEEDRPDFLKSLIVRNVLSNTKDSLGSTINRGYLTGPGIKFRSFYRWALTNYTTIGMPVGKLTATASVDSTAAASYIPVPAGKTAWVQKLYVGSGLLSYWVEQYLMANHPTRINEFYTADINDATQEVTIILADSSVLLFTASSFVEAAEYIYMYYNEVAESIDGPVVTGSTSYIGGSSPDTTGWTLTATMSDYIVTAALDTTTTTTKTYSDGSPTTSSSSTSTRYEDYLVRSRSYERVTYQGQDTGSSTDRIRSLREIMYFYEDKVVVTGTSTTTTQTESSPGVTETTTTETTTEDLQGNNSVRVDEQEIKGKEWSPLKLYIYRVGTGTPGLDALIQTNEEYSNFYPVIPVRVDNKMVDETFLGAVAYEEITKAYKKATTGKFDKLIDKLNENAQIGDIDHAFAVFGVALNVVEQSCREYLWNFFDKLRVSQIGDAITFAAWQASVTTAEDNLATWQAWKQAQSNDADPLHGTNEPPLPVVDPMPQNEIDVSNAGSDIKYDVRISWNYISKTETLGLGKPDATVGEIWFEQGNSFSIGSNAIYTADGYATDNNLPAKSIKLFRQTTEAKFEVMELVGLLHRNYVYGLRAVETTGTFAIDDLEESGFIVPLHYDTYRAMSLKNATQMSTACIHLMLNSYDVKKAKWYESGLFKILVIVVIAIASVVFTGGAGLGILGTHISVGTALGFSGMTAAIVGSVANAMAALLLSTILEKTFSNMGIIGQLLSVAIMMTIGQISNGLNSTGAWAIQWDELLRVDNLMKLTNALGRGIAQEMGANTMAMQQDWMDFSENAVRESKKIQQAYFEEFGYGAGQIDPTMFVDATSGPIAESSATFLTRTLLSGSEIAEMSHDLLYDFPTLSLELPNAFT